MKGTELEKYEPIGPAVWRKFAQLLPLHTEGLRTNFIVQACNRDEYDHAVECAGGRFIEVGGDEGATARELKDAYDPERVAAYYYTLKSNSGVPLEDFVEIAHKVGSPVILDACGTPPPKDGICPFIDLYEILLKKARHIAGELKKISGVNIRIDNIIDQEGVPRIPLCAVKIDEKKYGMSTKELHLSLLKGSPGIMTVNEPYFLIDNYQGIFSINPQFLTKREENEIIDRIIKLAKNT
jgi:hypothetical protein